MSLISIKPIAWNRQRRPGHVGGPPARFYLFAAWGADLNNTDSPGVASLT